MERQHIHAPLDREAVYHAIWPELADDIRLFGATDFKVDRMIHAEGYALEYLLDQIEGNACTRTEAISMALDLMREQPDADYYDGFAPLWYVVIKTPEALKTIHALLAATPNAARRVGDTVYFERRDEADWIGTLVAGEMIGISLADPAPPPPHLRQLQRLAAKQRGAGYYSKHSTVQMIEAIIYRANAGELLSNLDQDVPRNLDNDDSRGETGEDRHPC